MYYSKSLTFHVQTLFEFSENTKIYAALCCQKLKRKTPVKCCIGYSKDIYLFLQINEADIIMTEFLKVRDFTF